MMKSIPLQSTAIDFGATAYERLAQRLEKKKYSTLFILTDSHTIEWCLPLFLQQLSTTTTLEIIEIEAGEAHKTIATCVGVWESMGALGGDRKSALIALGGGVVTDLGGFVAATFKRGIDFYLIPTSLLAMVDAAVGGKTGVDLNGLKNEVGAFALPEAVLIDADYLNTLPAEHMKSGWAEMLKHGLITDAAYWEELIALSELTTLDLERLVQHSIGIKERIVAQDPQEKGVRKILNFGHTLGHAIETHFLTQDHLPTLLHGYAVAAGMVLASYLSFKNETLAWNDYQKIKKILLDLYGKINFSSKDIEVCLSLLAHDKKNENGKVLFSLLHNIGHCVHNQEVPTAWICEAFEDYLNE